MMYPYMTLADDTEIVHSEIIEENNIQTVLVHFERSTEDGFDSARCRLPDYEWIKRNGFSDKEVEKFQEFLIHNAHLIYKYAGNGGIQIA